MTCIDIQFHLFDFLKQITHLENKFPVNRHGTEPFFFQTQKCFRQKEFKAAKKTGYCDERATSKSEKEPRSPTRCKTRKEIDSNFASSGAQQFSKFGFKLSLRSQSNKCFVHLCGPCTFHDAEMLCPTPVTILTRSLVGFEVVCSCSRHCDNTRMKTADCFEK